MKILKFGGSSVATAKSITKVREIVLDKASKGSAIVVCSALEGVTSEIINCSELATKGDSAYLQILADIEKRHINIAQTLLAVKNQSHTISKVKILLNELEDILRGVFLIGELSTKTTDRLTGYGELLSTNIITDYFKEANQEAEWVNMRELIVTDNNFGRANVDLKTTSKRIRAFFKERQNLCICPGFIASNKNGEATTIGRGGSDYTAALLAAALKASQLEIWTDVSGMLTADPKLVRSAYVIPKISYEEAMELSHFGAKVIYPPTIQPVLRAGIPIHIKNTFDKDADGTIISDSPDNNGQMIKGLSCIQNIALFNLTGSGMVGIPNFSNRLFNALSQAKVNVIMITQASSEHSICVCIDASDADIAKQQVEEEFEYEIASHKVNALQIETDLAIIALVGSRMIHQVGVSGQMFSELGQNGVNIKAIAQGSSERNISVAINKKEVKKAINALHESFFLSEKKRINLFVVGVGNVGGALLNQLEKQRSYLNKHHHLDLRVVALANSKKMLFEEHGIALKNWKESMKAGEKMNMKSFIKKMEFLNLRNSIFIDNTANESVSDLYIEILNKSISVVTPNKIACTKDYDLYLNLKHTALKYKSRFLFETNVGAGLPVINTLNDLIKSGDEIVKIEAVLSGSLNFIFNHFSSETRFADIVKTAKREGYTEPDPRIDLSGVDVKRKILILIRESGLQMELNEINTKPFIPEDCMNAKTVEGFFEKLTNNEETFQKLVEKSDIENTKIKYVATFDKGKAETGLKFIEKGHPFYDLEGKDNIVLFTTKRYPKQPLVIKGAGAGAEVTASGIFADIMRIANS